MLGNMTAAAGEWIKEVVHLSCCVKLGAISWEIQTLFSVKLKVEKRYKNASGISLCFYCKEKNLWYFFVL